MHVHYVYTCIGTCASEEIRVTPKNRIVLKKSESWTESQTEILMATFQANVFPEIMELRRLAESFNVSRKKVQNWFSGERRKLVRRGMLPESE